MKIYCKTSKKGNLYWCLMFGEVYVSFDRLIIERVALSVGYSLSDIYSMTDGDVLEV